MSIKRAVGPVAGVWLLLVAMPAFAHHAFSAEFDADKPFDLTGLVTRIDWLNPHVWFYIDVKSGAEQVTSWGIEMGSPNGLMRNGWTRNSMKVGDIVKVEGSLARDGSNRGNARSVLLTSNGKRLFAGSSQGQTP